MNERRKYSVVSFTNCIFNLTGLMLSRSNRRRMVRSKFFMTLVKIGFDQLVEFLVCWGILRCVVVVVSIPAKEKKKFDKSVSLVC